MGAAASVTIHPSNIVDKHFKELLLSKKLRNELFNDIASCSEDGHITLKDKISLKKLVMWFSDNKHPLYNDFKVNVTVLSEAFKQTIAKRKQEQMSQKDIHEFLPNLFLFCKLYDVFDEADKAVIEDNKVFKGEFIKSKALIAKVEGVTMVDVADEDWENEFVKLDKSKDGFISFSEFCTYAVKNIIKPKEFVNEYTEQDSEDIPAPAEPTDEESPVAAVSELSDPPGPLLEAVEAVFSAEELSEAVEAIALVEEGDQQPQQAAAEVVLAESNTPVEEK